MKTFVYKLRPSPAQATLFDETLETCRRLYNHPLAKSISDAGWGLFVNVLRAKAESAGRVVREVNPGGTSQTCAQCGEHVPKRLAVRWHSCPYCGCELHRDHDAALNILKKGGGTAFGEALPLAGHRTEPRTRQALAARVSAATLYSFRARLGGAATLPSCIFFSAPALSSTFKTPYGALDSL